MRLDRQQVHPDCPTDVDDQVGDDLIAEPGTQDADQSSVEVGKQRSVDGVDHPAALLEAVVALEVAEVELLDLLGRVIETVKVEDRVGSQDYPMGDELGIHNDVGHLTDCKVGQ